MIEKKYSFPRFIVFAVAAAAAAFVFQSCNTDVSFSESASVKKDGWAATDTLDFSIPAKPGNNGEDLYIWVRHSQDYAYSNIWLKVVTELPLDDSDGLIEIPLADKSGRWLGTCSQSMCTARLMIRKSLQADEAGSYRFAVVQYMRETSLAGVRNVGVEIRKPVDEQEVQPQ